MDVKEFDVVGWEWRRGYFKSEKECRQGVGGVTREGIQIKTARFDAD